ncbi:carbohydrate-responsive element-binding protein-like isoform X1 [Erpetoichthys calabaricus]|uniref:BHLH domain-containing protein n=1 Tax=Erpetoichthys calabaricus TaxID=27687 RepID=A0A8C4T7B8_ERPCA|nr:carbohydrate-responsive element-binding protein-like isoform X1 [Erpetoichthys calabaricus]
MAKANRLSFSARNVTAPVPESDTDSDSEPEEELEIHAGAAHLPTKQVIHSGHFMVSAPHCDSGARRKRRSDSTTLVCHEGAKSDAGLTTDPTLTRLFECMTLVYSGKIVSPKWKSFKGLCLLWRDKIRLNNGIWRAWYIQYVEKRKSPMCGFVTPLEGSEADTHRKPEAIVLEGNYWKRRIEVVIKEYHKWRIYHKKRLQKNKDGTLNKADIYSKCVKKWPSQSLQDPSPMEEGECLFDLDCFLSDISDTLFTMTQNPWLFHGEQEKTYATNADIIQPGLTPLQPNVDEFVDISDIFMNNRNQPHSKTAFPGYCYYSGTNSSEFCPAASSVQTDSLLMGNSPLQENINTDGMSHSQYHRGPLSPEISYEREDVNTEFKYKPATHYKHLYDFHPMGVLPESPLYGHQPSKNANDPVQSTSNVVDACFSSYSDLYPKYRCSSGVTSSVITYTGTTSTPTPWTSHQLVSSSQNFGVFPPLTPSSMSLSEPSVSAGTPSNQGTCRFSVPERRSPGSSVKCKQTIQTGKSEYLLSPSIMVQGSCLAKLLSEGKSATNPDASFSEVKAHLAAFPKSPSESNNLLFSYGGGSSSCDQSDSTLPSFTNTSSLIFPMGQRSSPVHYEALSDSKPIPIPKKEKTPPISPQSNKSDFMTLPNVQEKLSSPQGQHGFLSLNKAQHTKGDSRRITHISAEQKRRFNIKIGFDTLQGLVSTLSSPSSIKISKAAILNKTAEYIAKMQQERTQIQEEAQHLRNEIVKLNSAINVCQQKLPATGVPITRQRFDHMREMFDEYVRTQTVQNWKFWIFSIIFRPLFESYNGMVSTGSVDDFCRTALAWLEQHCSLPALRPTVLSALRQLSTSTSILTDPTIVPEQAIQAVNATSSTNACS